MEDRLTPELPSASISGDGVAPADSGTPRSASRWGCRRCLILTTLALVAAGATFLWWTTRPLDTTPPEVVLIKPQPDKPLFAENERQVTFVLRDAKGGIPTFFLFPREDQKATALAINTLRRTPDERGVEIRFEAIRFRADESDPGKLWVRAVGIANESDGKTPISLKELESGQPLDLAFHDEIQVPYVAHVIYDISMTIQYHPLTQRLAITNAAGSIRWKMLGTDAFDEGKLETAIEGQKGEYAEKPLLRF